MAGEKMLRPRVKATPEQAAGLRILLHATDDELERASEELIHQGLAVCVACATSGNCTDPNRHRPVIERALNELKRRSEALEVETYKEAGIIK